MAAPAVLEAQVPVLADLALEAQVLDLALLQVEARLLDLALLQVGVQLLVLVHRVLEPAAPVQRLLSRQSSSAAMARSTT